VSALPILEVAIGLSFTYLLLALITTTVTEWITRVLNSRGTMLLEGLRQLLGEQDKGGGGLTKDVLAHPLISSFAQPKPGGKPRIPSYVPSDVFAKVLLNVLEKRPVESDGKTRKDVSQHLEQALAALTPAGEGAKASADPATIARWYEQQMERVSGWYKRHTQTVVLVVAAVLTLLINADTVTLVRRLWSDSALRATVIESAKVRLEQGPPLHTVEYVDPTTPKPTAPIRGASPNEVLAEEELLAGRLMGWSGELEAFNAAKVVWIALHLLGWLLTVLAVSLGAPFWFDTLNRLTNLRSSGPPPKPSKPVEVTERRP